MIILKNKELLTKDLVGFQVRLVLLVGMLNIIFILTVLPGII